MHQNREEGGNHSGTGSIYWTTFTDSSRSGTDKGKPVFNTTSQIPEKGKDLDSHTLSYIEILKKQNSRNCPVTEN